MIAPIILIVLCFLTYLLHNKLIFLFSLVVLVSAGFFILPEERMCINYANILILLIAIKEIITSNHHFWNTNDDIIGKSIKWIVLLFCVNFVITILFQIEKPYPALKVLISNLFLLYYFVFRQYTLAEINCIKKPIFICSLIGAILYYLQFAGIFLLQGRIDEDGFGIEGNYRLLNTPHFLLAILLYLLYSKDNIPYRKLYVALFSPLIILPMSRSLIIGFFVANIIYLLLVEKDSKNILKFFLPTFILSIILYPLLESRFSVGGTMSNVGFIEEVKNAFTLQSSTSYENLESRDTFVFRIALFVERIEYLLNHPVNIIVGLGSIDESFDLYNQFGFRWGTHSAASDSIWYPRQIVTTDISFITHVMRYGIFYLVFISLFIINSFKRLVVFKDDIYAKIGIILFILSLIRCLASVPYYDIRINRMFLLLLIPAVFYNIYKKNNK